MHLSLLMSLFKNIKLTGHHLHFLLFFLFFKLIQEVTVDKKWGQKGGPWEFNLRDLFRWCQLMQTDQSPGFFNPGQHVGLVYADRMRTETDKAQVTPLM